MILNLKLMCTGNTTVVYCVCCVSMAVHESFVLFCLQTLRYLAELSANIPTMKNELGMMVSLENLMAR